MTTVILIDPKVPANVGGAIRALGCLASGEKRLLMTGELPERVGWSRFRKAIHTTSTGHSKRNVMWERVAELPDLSSRGVCMEVDGRKNLWSAEFPEDPIFVFGRENQSVPSLIRQECAFEVRIESLYCLNLAAAVYVTLYVYSQRFENERLDRALKEFS